MPTTPTTSDNVLVVAVENGPDDLVTSSTSTDPKSAQKEPVGSVIACNQCRSRKVKCGSERPRCRNCVRRSDPCEYDTVPKRRGPDKQPGTRQRLYKKKPEGFDPLARPAGTRRGGEQIRKAELLAAGSTLPNRKGREKLPENIRQLIASSKLAEDPSLWPRTIWSRNGTTSTLDDTDLDVTIRAAGFPSLEGLLQITENDIQDTSQRFSVPNFQESFIESFWEPGPIFSTSHLSYQPQRVFSMTKEGTIVEILNAHEYVPRGPSVTFSKQTWWDALLPLYSQDPHQASQKIFQDLNFLLSSSIHWLSFIHLGRFMQNLYDPARRVLIQPSVVLSALAMATLMRSSETGLGREGRKFALWLRDAAQASLDASVNASWIDPSLAQAAFFLTLFESSTHPVHSSARASSAVYLLDSIIQALGLTAIDAHDPTVSMFPAEEIPITSGPSMTSLFGEDIPPMNRMAACPWHGTDPCPSSCSHSPLNSDHSPQSTQSKSGSFGNPEIPKEIESASHKMTSLQDNAFGKIDWPLDDIEIQREESRRLCWSSMLLVHMLKEYTPHLMGMGWELHISRQENFAIHFPGSYIEGNRKQNNGLWALHCRAALLWNACHKLRQRPDWEFRRTELLGKAWIEATCIEIELGKRTASMRHIALNAGREYIFHLKLLISNQFTRLMPFPHTLHFDRDSAKEWLAHREELATHVRKTLFFVTRFGTPAASLAFAKRPLSVWWAMYQINAGIMVWKSDPSLIIALEQSLEFLAMADFMTEMWQSEPQRVYYEKMRNELIQCCLTAGVSVPAPVPIPGLQSHPNATMTPSPFLSKKPSPSDILMAPLD